MEQGKNDKMILREDNKSLQIHGNGSVPEHRLELLKISLKMDT